MKGRPADKSEDWKQELHPGKFAPEDSKTILVHNLQMLKLVLEDWPMEEHNSEVVVVVVVVLVDLEKKML